ncbi:hypothetical protein MTO96_007146 [Rhipicephalus appendiculatus]
MIWQLVVLGTPAEEAGCGKELLIRKGALEGVDAALMAHPCPSDMLKVDYSAAQQLKLHFKGKAAHAGATPWEGVNALDAAVAAYTNVSLLRQHLKPNTKIHGVITEGGKFPNVIPEDTEMVFTIRAPNAQGLIELRPRAEACFRAAADATGCSLDIERKPAYMNVVQNSVIAETYRKHAHAFGVSFVDDVVKDTPTSGGGTDCGNVSYRVPTIHPLFGLRAHEGSMNHTRGFTTVANAADSQPPTLRVAKILALTVLDLLRDADLLREAKREFTARKLPSEEELRTALS